eukprot:TRINITY_DN4554_c1_g3_i2.p1 TRINITY_DN4554_c1_g3~~TRINITY_DN4554_c1_g3_i2.p1  ORF type:complete len:337 (-),score=18.29 TRINITY_DN4554_c1_g3_i2:32-1042(-)
MSCDNYTCHGNGECQILSGSPVCVCGLRFDSKTQCSTGYFEVWGDSIIIYLSLGYLVSVILGPMFMYETFKDALMIYRKRRFKTIILPKIFGLLFVVLRFIHYMQFTGYYIEENDGQFLILDEFFYILGLSSGFACYTCVVLLWIDFVTGVKNLDISDSLTKQFKISTVIFIILLVVYIPVSVVLHFYGTIGKNVRGVITSYAVLSAIYFIVHIVWSSILIHKVNIILRDYKGKFKKFRYRNNLFAVLNGSIAVMAIAGVLMSSFRASESPWGYLGVTAYYRVNEYTSITLALMISQSYLNIKKGWCSTPSESLSQMSTNNSKPQESSTDVIDPEV